MKKLNVLSLFDGISCGRVALERAGFEINEYYASEIDKFATQVSEKNWPDIKRLGDVTKWREWNIDWASIDLVLAGSPCQGFSKAGKQKAFEDPRSVLFFEFVNILNNIRVYNPEVKFLLENVKMRGKSEKTISAILGTDPVIINSSLLSAQNRVRLYWTNWEVEQPNDKKIILNDILQDQDEIDEKYFLSDHAQKRVFDRMESNQFDCFNYYNNSEITEKSKSLITTCGSWTGKSSVLIIREATKKGFIEVAPGSCFDYTQPNSKTRRGRDMSVKSNCLTAGSFSFLQYTKNHDIRKLTPVECERLQTLPDNYTAGVSDTQRYKALGNGWTVDVIVHIFEQLKESM